MRLGRTMVAAAAMAVALSACATAGTGSQTSYNRINAEEIAEMKGQVGNLYELISRLRPRWLEARSTQTSLSGGAEREVVVYQDQSLLGGLDMLQSIGLDMPLYLSYLDGAQATAQLAGLGSRRVEGAIIIHTR